VIKLLWSLNFVKLLWGYNMKAAIWALTFSLLLFSSIGGVLCSGNLKDLPGVYEVASNGQLNISIADIHRCDAAGQDGWFLAIGLVVENRQNRSALLDPASFRVLNGQGKAIPASRDCALRNPLGHRELGPGEVAVGGMAFQLEDADKPVMLVNTDAELKIRLDKEAKPPGTPKPAGEPIKIGNCVVGIEGISGSKDGRMLRVDYILKNSGPGVMLLEPRDYGRFGVLIDAFGWSYNACDYEMLGPAVAPGGTVEGFMTYMVPDSPDHPRYLLFWPPDEDAILFDLTTEAY
jgi:hypothetical protein